MSIFDSASRLFALLAAEDVHFTRHLQPGLTPERIRQITVPVEPALPAEVITFYGHFDLPKGYAYGPEQPTFYGIYWLLGLEDAVAFWLERRAYDFLDPREHTLFPFLQEDGNGYFVDTVADAAGHHRIVSLFHGCAPEPMFLNLTAMFDTLYQWARDGALSIEAGHVAGDYEGDPKVVAAIAARLNPGIAHWSSRPAP